MGLRCNGRLRRERNHAIRAAVILHDGDHAKAAAYLGIARSTVSECVKPADTLEEELAWMQHDRDLERAAMLKEIEELKMLIRVTQAYQEWLNQHSKGKRKWPNARVRDDPTSLGGDSQFNGVFKRTF